MESTLESNYWRVADSQYRVFAIISEPIAIAEKAEPLTF